MEPFRFDSPRRNYSSAIHDIEQLIADYKEPPRGSFRRTLESGVAKRASIILLITAWETFIEDTLRDAFKSTLDAAKQPKDMQSAFNVVARSWIEAKHQQPTALEEWTGDGWRSLVERRFKDDLTALNTPNSENIRKLYKRYLRRDITASWKWQGKASKAACDDLDKLIVLRGELVHRSKKFLQEDRLSINHVRKQLDLVNRLVRCTTRALEPIKSRV
jgi:hypothetical protein